MRDRSTEAPRALNMPVMLGTTSIVLSADLLGIYLFSSVGIASTLANAMASSEMDQAGNLAAVLCAVLVALAYIVDFHHRNFKAQVYIGAPVMSLFLMTSVLKIIKYPHLPCMICLCLPVVLMSHLRAKYFDRHVLHGQEFFKAAALGFGVSFLAVLVIWFRWMFAMHREWSQETMAWLATENSKVYEYVWKGGSLNYSQNCSSPEQWGKFPQREAGSIQAACAKAANICILQWSGPFVLCLCNLLTACLCITLAKMTKDIETSSEEGAIIRLKEVLKGIIYLVVMMLGLVYFAATFVSAEAGNLSAAFICLAAVTIAAAFGWMYLEIDFVLLERCTQQGLTAIIVEIGRSEWMKAMAVAGLNVLLPTMAVLDMARQKYRKLTGRTSVDDADVFTRRGRRIYDEMATWKWSGILVKVILLGEVAALLLVGTKATFIFFSWLNSFLEASGMSFAVISVVIGAVGLIMFLNPVVPGSVVYLFAGIALGRQAQIQEEPTLGPGLWPGVFVTVVVSTGAKLVACVGQYLIGYFAGKSLAVQSFVGVDTVPIRAMEQVLQKPGFALDKIAILAVGPDWPTSVLCGILGLDIVSMLIGTLPTICVSIIPQVVVGALLTREKDSESEGFWNMVSNGATGCAAAVQAAATAYCSYSVMMTAERDRQKLSESRSEHEALAALTAEKTIYDEAYEETSKFEKIDRLPRALLIASGLGILSSGFVLLIDEVASDADKFCLRQFYLMSDMYDPLELGGLDTLSTKSHTLS
eukprot:TRINITY_DN24288_c0_g1_i2.p1 TRINITY_DN24288_c0_g1~~TRINITY_DN24288_c0_g1_i2.p1  ORF type:complete len:758 (-),score=137.53 TRINITY_DN24288_c0_g1_i2:127-2400(-)